MGERSDSRNSLPTVAEIAGMAGRGDDFTSYYTRRCITIKPIRRVNVHFTERLLRSLDEHAAHFDLSREATINMLVRQALIQQPQPKQSQSQNRANETA